MRKLLLLGVAGALALAAQTNDTFLIRNVTIHPVTGSEISDGSLLVQDGKIAEIGTKIVPPKGMKVIEGKGLHVYPGMIDSATELGLSEIESVRTTVDVGEIGEFTPQLRAEVAINPASEHIPVTRANGVTSAITIPAAGGRGGGGRGGGGGTIISGQAALIHLDGWTWEEMEVRKSAAMQMMFPALQSAPARFGGEGGADPAAAGGRGSFTEAQRAYNQRLKVINDFFDEARRYQKAKAAHVQGFKTDLRFEAMIPVLEGKVPLMVSANRERSIRDAISFAEKQRVRIIVAGPRKVGAAAADLKAKNIPVILGPTLALPSEEDDPYDEAFSLPAELNKAGVKFAFGSFGNQFARNLGFQAANAVAFGLPVDVALKAVTINPAEIWGIADEYGSIEKGKWADLIITDGDPLEAKTQIKQEFIRGRPIDLSSKHTRLYDKYMGRQ